MCSSQALYVVFLMETKNNANFVRRKINACSFADTLIVNPDGIAGGLVLAWKEYISVSVVKYAFFFFLFFLSMYPF